jgi:hypothetical protein
MTYRTAADVPEQMFPVGVGKDKETIVNGGDKLYVIAQPG